MSNVVSHPSHNNSSTRYLERFHISDILLKCFQKDSFVPPTLRNHAVRRLPQ